MTYSFIISHAKHQYGLLSAGDIGKVGAPKRGDMNLDEFKPMIEEASLTQQFTSGYSAHIQRPAYLAKAENLSYACHRHYY